MAELSAMETACAKRLAEYYDKGLTLVRHSREELEKDCADLGFTVESREAVLGRMEYLGVIENVVHGSPLRFLRFTISPHSVEVARAIEALEEEASKPQARDIVAEIQEKAKGNPVIAWSIIGIIVLTAAATFINQTISIFQNLGWMAKP